MNFALARRHLFFALLLFTLGAPIFAQDDTKLTVWLIGDSTVKNGAHGGVGWGQVVHEAFDLDRINVVNRAVGGRSSRTYRLEGKWQAVLDVAKPGDFVLIQFGHNDGANPTDPKKPRGSIRGMGDETIVWQHPQRNEEETIHTYGWYMRHYVAEAKEAGLVPIICSYVPRAPRRGKQVNVGLDDMYGSWSKQVATQTEATFINLYSRVAAEYKKMEAEQPHSVKETLFVGGDRDYTHTVQAGAELNAEKVVEGIRDLDEGDAAKLKEYLKDVE